MAKTKGRAGRGAKTAGRGRLRTRKSSTSKAPNSESRKPKPVKRSSIRQKVAPASEAKRLKKQLKAAKVREQEALERQIATADILKVIASSPSDVQPVFDAIATSSKHLISGFSTAVFRFVDGVAHLAAFTPITAEADELLRAAFPLPVAEFEPFKVAQGDQPVQIKDTENYPNPRTKQIARARGYRSMLLTPLMSNGQPIGLISVTRTQPGTFADQHVQLLQTFADQAVIAIENVRLFNETEEALERQTATAEILKVIASSPNDVQPVFDTIAESARRVVGGFSAVVTRVIGKEIHLAAFTTGSEAGKTALTQMYPQSISSSLAAAQVVRSGQIFMQADTESDTGVTKGLARARGFRSLLSVPMLRNNIVIGTINVTRVEPGGFDENAIILMRTFADQAVIAVENARLFNETQEALEQQTATADILKVIASSPADVQPVFQAIADRSKLLVNGFATTVVKIVDETVHLSAFTSTNAAADAALKSFYPQPMSVFTYSEDIRQGRIHRVVDAEVDVADQPAALDMIRRRGWRSALWVPLLREGKAIGVIGATRVEPGPFADRHVELLQTFADQAVIAIENARLFNEVQERTRELTEALTYQTGSSNILRVIASSPTNVTPVLQAIVESACELCEANDAIVYLRDGHDLRLSAHHGPIGFTVEKWPIARASAAGQAFLDRASVHIRDVLSEEGDKFPEGQQAARRIGVRTMLGVPLLREGESIGTILLRRTEVLPFSDKQIALLQTFADQAVIAIGNVRLFEEVQAKTHELSRSLDDLRTAQDRLVQTEKLASLGQLTAGIAHEIKNPLNFVNNFSALSVELINEMTEAFENPALDEAARRKELDDIRELLKGNLEKVVQHGKRADSIVKNMLQHSREVSAERRSADVNALVAESLNLAYHGARAETPDFTIALKHELDPEAGAIDLYPQEITRALLNIISNGFYAATRRKAESDEETFEPLLSAATKNLGQAVEIRIRDNGTGIPPDVREKIFNPFFTTKPTGEGTGLGLSMTHDIIVKQHGGRIDVETEPGAFSEFVITLPRGNGN